MKALHSFLRRRVRRSPHTLMALGVLALGLTACLAVFTYVNGFLQPFPGVESAGLVRFFEHQDDNPYGDLSVPDFEDYRESLGQVFSGVAADQSVFAASVRHEKMTEVVFGQAVSGGYFEVLSIDMSTGRGLTREDDRPEADPAAVISHRWWQRHWNGDPAVLGSTLLLNYKPFTVVGVASPQFLGSTSDFQPDVWIPTEPFKVTYTTWAAASKDRDVPLARVYGRLRSGVNLEQCSAALQTTANSLDQEYPGRESPRRLRVEPATWIDPLARIDEEPMNRLMAVAVAGLLLLVCANVASLLLSVAAGRRREMATRAALGASPRRLLGSVLGECVALSTAAGGVALVLAGPVSSRLGSYFASPSVWGANVPRITSIDGRVVVFALVVSLLTGLVAGLAPALHTRRRDLVKALKPYGDGVPGVPRRLWSFPLPGARDVLVSAQVALSVVLLVVAGLVLRTLLSVGALDPGFSYQNLVASYVSTSSTSVEVEDRERFFRELIERLSEEPWVAGAAVASSPLLSPHRSAELRLEGHTETEPLVYTKVVPGFFGTVGIDVISGRSFERSDTADRGGVAIVNQTLARRFFPEEEATGRHIWWPGTDGEEDRRFEIVGVVTDAKHQEFISEAEPLVYFSQPQHHYAPGNALLVETTIDPAASVPLLMSWLRELEPHIAIVNVLPYTEVINGFLYTQKMNAELFSTLAALGLLLAAVGIFGVLTLAVGRRTREIGIRISVGAEKHDIARLVLARAFPPVALGLAVGLLSALALQSLVKGLLFGVEPTDPVTLVMGTLLLLAAAALASYLPARRALRVDPVTALRHE